MRRLIFCLAVLLCSGVAMAQGEANSLEGVPAKDRIVTGGGLGLSFSSYQDFFSISPQVGYMLTRRLMVGTGLTYRYTKYKDYSPSITFNDWGVNPFVRFTVFQNIFIQTEYEYLNYEDLKYPVTAARETVRRGYNSFLAGGGFVQPVGQKASFYIMAMYNFSYRDPAPGEYSPYSTPLIIRAGINIGGLSF
ncbi:MAG TPA: hypothetical protein VFZ52_06980 [Chryseolinea sp.]